MVGCTTCANLCQGRCISFPLSEDLRRFYKDYRVWSRIKEAMVAEGKIPAPDNLEEGDS